MVLVACGIFDDDEGGNTLHVQRSPVQGARIYFDMNNDGRIDATDETMQDAVFPQGFVTDSTGRAHNIPAVFQGLPFKAVLDGAIDADTGDPLSGAMFSIPDANGAHRLTSPITDLLADDSKTPETVARELLPNADSEEITRILEAINNPRNYLGGHDGVEGFAFFLATETEAGRTPTPTDRAVQSKAAQYLTDNRDTLIVVNEDADADPAFIDLPAKTIGAHDAYVATIQAVSHVGAVAYRFVEADGEDTTISDFNINSQGIISFIGENPTTTTLHIEVSNGNAAETEIVRVEVTVADAPTVNELPDGDETATIMENVAGASGTGTALITGITISATNPSWEISEANTAGLSAIMSKFDIVSGTGITFNLVLKTGESLDYEAILRGVLNLHLWAKENGVRSNALELRIQVEKDPDEVGFSGSFTGIVAEDGNLIAQWTISVENHPENEDINVSSQGTYGRVEYADGRWTYTLDDSIARVDGLRDGQVLLDIVELSIGTPAISQNIIIRINGTDEDVHFLNDTSTRTADASVDVELGNPVLSGVDIFNGLTLTNANLADIEIDFAETGGNYALFTITDAGHLTFTGTNEDVAGLGNGITLNLEITAPTLTEATLPFALQVNVINEVDDGESQYEIIGDVIAGETLEVRRISEDPDGEGAVSIAWYRGDATTPTGTRGTTYRVTAADEGETIGAVITYMDGANEPESIDITASSVAFASGMGSRSINMDEGTIPTTTLATVSATSKLGEAVSYAIGTTDDSALFNVNGNGKISLNASGTWDYESNKKEYVVEVIASAADGAGGTDTARARITFAVQDVNDNAPIFTQSTYAVSIPETLAESAFVVSVAAKDADGTARYNIVTYSITAGNTGNVFDVDDNGVITLLSALDYETTPSYTLEITATDGSLTDTAMVEITLTDINDESPTVQNQAPTGTARITAAADNLSGTRMGYRITVTDGDATNNFDVDIIAGDVGDRFEFRRQGNTNTWELFLDSGEEIALSELGDTITLTYRVTDGGEGTNPRPPSRSTRPLQPRRRPTSRHDTPTRR